MPFAYYDRLIRAQQRVYRRNDDIASVSIPRAEELRPLIEAVAGTLAKGDRARLHERCHRLEYELLRLPDSIHTDSFYGRESSLLRQRLPSAEGAETP